MYLEKINSPAACRCRYCRENSRCACIGHCQKNGGKPVYGVYSAFIQRTYDRLSQDLCINSNPADILAQNRLTKEQIVDDILSL